MSAFNRFFVSLLSLGWLGALAGCLILVWDGARTVDGEDGNVRWLFDIDLTTNAEQILATIVLGGLMLLGLVLLAFELVPRSSGPRVVREDRSSERYRDLQTRVESLQNRIDDRPREVVKEREEKETVEHREPVGVTHETTTERRELREDHAHGRRRWHILNR